MTAPTTARVTSLSSWNHFFHRTTGVFRVPHTEGSTIQHLDIDLRFVVEDAYGPDGVARDSAELYLPIVNKVTLRGGEFIQESEERMDSLAEVLFAVKPSEVQWLNAETDPSEQLTFSTHLVHPAIIAAGEAWGQRGNLRTLVVQGGFPCPNLTAPTPFSQTPAHTPCPSPGPTRSTFGNGLSSIPALSTTKPKPADEHKLKEREERRRLAEYSLKPRFDFAFGAWGAQEIRWRLDGRYTPQCIMAIINHLFNALSTTYPSLSRKTSTDLPSLLTFAPFPQSKLQDFISLPTTMDLAPDLSAHLQDTLFISTSADSGAYFRPWFVEVDDEDRQPRRMKAEMILLSDEKSTIVHEPITSIANGNGNGNGHVEMVFSPEMSETEDERDAIITPELMNSMVVERNEGEGSKETMGLGLTGTTLLV